jgi:hypothetical protein
MQFVNAEKCLCRSLRGLKLVVFHEWRRRHYWVAEHVVRGFRLWLYRVVDIHRVP